MIDNIRCPYCNIKLIKKENKSSEHFIPNAALSITRTKGDGDFYACISCNNRKGRFDEIVGKCAKIQSDDIELAIATLEHEFKKEHSKIAEALSSVSPLDDGGASFKNPLSRQELYEYMEFLGKGVYFIYKNKVFNPRYHIFSLRYVPAHALKTFEAHYRSKQGSNPYRDLETNPRSKVIKSHEGILYKQGSSYIVFIQDYFGVMIKVMNNTASNRKKALKYKFQFLTETD